MKKLVLALTVVQIIMIVAISFLWVSFVGGAGSKQTDKVLPPRPCFARSSSAVAPCTTSFGKVMVNPLAFDGRRIILVGYLSMRYGIPMLYASRDDYENDVVSNAIAVVGNRSELEGLVGEFGGGYVRVDGNFTATSDEKNYAWMGEISPPFRAEVPPPPMKQGKDDILVPVEYMEMDSK